VLKGTSSHYLSPKLMWDSMLRHRDRNQKERPEMYARIQKNRELTLTHIKHMGGVGFSKPMKIPGGVFRFLYSIKHFKGPANAFLLAEKHFITFNPRVVLHDRCKVAVEIFFRFDERITFKGRALSHVF